MKRRGVSHHTPNHLIRKRNTMVAERRMEERRQGIKEEKMQGFEVVKGGK